MKINILKQHNIENMKQWTHAIWKLKTWNIDTNNKLKFEKMKNIKKIMNKIKQHGNKPYANLNMSSFKKSRLRFFYFCVCSNFPWWITNKRFDDYHCLLKLLLIFIYDIRFTLDFDDFAF